MAHGCTHLDLVFWDGHTAEHCASVPANNDARFRLSTAHAVSNASIRVISGARLHAPPPW